MISHVKDRKPLVFIGTSRDDLRSFGEEARRDAGFELDAVQRGLAPSDWKPMTSVGRGVREIRVRDDSGAYRVIYLAVRAEAVYVLHAFQKKTQKTALQDLVLAKQRLKLIGD
jgi:phage-related protein